MSDKVIAEIPVSGGQIKVLLQEFRGVTKLHVRRWYQEEGKTEWLPTKSGVALSKEEAIQVLDALKLGIDKF